MAMNRGTVIVCNYYIKQRNALVDENIENYFHG